MHIRDELMEKIKDLGDSAYQLLRQEKAGEALQVADKILALDPEDLNACQVAAGVLIDAGSDSGDLAAVERGMSLLAGIIHEPSKIDESSIAHIKYNLSNAYGELYSRHRDKDPGKAAGHLARQKELLQEILLRRAVIPPELEPMALTNYANLLDHSHRTFEAVEFYLECLRIDPGHAVARGNCGEALRRVQSFSEQHSLRNLQGAWEHLSEAVEDPSSIAHRAGPVAYRDLLEKKQGLLLRIEASLEKGSKTLEEFRLHRLEAHSHPAPPAWLAEVIDTRLLLSFNLLPLNSEDEAKDDLFFDVIAMEPSKEDSAKAVELINLFSSIKEEYICSRHIYFHAWGDRADLNARNSSAYYGDPEGDVEFGLVSGLLKASLRMSVDLLDKIAVFLLIYFELGSPKRNPNFNNVWFESFNPKSGTHPNLAEPLERNYPLMGLRDTQRDFFLQQYPGPVKDARNAAVHRWLRLSHLPVDPDKAGASWNLHDFADITLFVLRQAKCSVMQLAAAVNVEEQWRSRGLDRRGKIAVPNPFFIRKPISARADEDLKGELESDEGRDDLL